MPRISRTAAAGGASGIAALWIRLDPVEALGVPVEQLLLVMAAEAFRRQDHPVRVDLAQVGAEENVDRPVRPEHDPIRAKGFDAMKDPRSDAFDGPVVVDHSEAGDLARHVGSLGERGDLTLPQLV